MFYAFMLLPIASMILLSFFDRTSSPSVLDAGLFLGVIIGTILLVVLIRFLISKKQGIFFFIFVFVMAIAVFPLLPLPVYMFIVGGAVCNSLAILFNNGKMPVAPKDDFAYWIERLDDSEQHKMAEGPNLPFLVDRFYFPGRSNGSFLTRDGLASIGDFGLLIGVWMNLGYEISSFL